MTAAAPWTAEGHRALGRPPLDRVRALEVRATVAWYGDRGLPQEGAGTVWLPVEAGNEPARRLYAGLSPVYTYAYATWT